MYAWWPSKNHAALLKLRRSSTVDFVHLSSSWDQHQTSVGTCQKNNNQIHKSANSPEFQKTEVVRQQERHLSLAAGEREFYKNCCKTTKEALTEHLKDVNFTEKRAPCSLHGSVHYSYDYAQQLHYPSNPYQPGPIYFWTPRKCGLFGVCWEAIPSKLFNRWNCTKREGLLCASLCCKQRHCSEYFKSKTLGKLYIGIRFVNHWF